MKCPSEEGESGTTFGLLRHGQTEWNVLKKVQGLADSPLTAHGREQAGQWAKALQRYGWHRIIASDLGRVKATVNLLNLTLQLPITFDFRLREQHWGEWEGLTLPFIQESFAEDLARRVAMGWGFAAPGGETRAAVRDRVLAALIAATEQWAGQNILVVCHQGVVKSVLYSIAGREFLPGEDPLLHLDRLHLIRCAGQQFTPVQLNILLKAEP